MSDGCPESRRCDLCSPQAAESLMTSSSRLRFLTRARSSIDVASVFVIIRYGRGADGDEDDLRLGLG